MAQTSMISSIEEGILSDLAAASLQVRDIDIDKIKAGLAHPGVFISTESGTCSKVTLSTWRCDISTFLVVIFRNVSSEKERRKGIYPILEGIMRRLLKKTLGMDIAPITPKRFRNVSTDDFRKKGLTAYEIELKTSFTFTAETAPEEDLLAVGLEYYLQDPVDDSESDAGDVVTLTE